MAQSRPVTETERAKVSSINQPLGIDQCNCFASRKAARQITRFYDAHLEPAGLRITQFLTLAALSETESVAVNALAERLDIERTAMGKMLGFLERDGLITIHPSPVGVVSWGSPKRAVASMLKLPLFGSKRSNASSN